MLVTGVVVSPFASREVFETARHWVEDVKKLNCEVRRSNLTIS
jgi:hypothetical protein